MSEAEPVYVTRGLLAVLVERAASADPDSVSIGLSATPAGDLATDGLAPETPVLTDFFHPAAGASIQRVFGVDLAVPPGRTHARFNSHPDGVLGVSRTDDFHAVMLVAVPPWEPGDVAAFGRRGERRDLRVLDVEPPTENVP